MIKAALKYLKNNINVVATDANKRALFPWTEFQKTAITPEQITKQLDHPKAAGLAVICGAVSGGLEVIDIDCKYDLTGELYERLMERIAEEVPTVIKKLVTIRTTSGGYHLYYRCEVIEGNLVFAQRYATQEEIKENPNVKIKVLIESRGQGGYVIAPPTTGYQVISGGTPQLISIEEREAMLSVCRSFNEVVKEFKPGKPVEAEGFGKTPWEDYNERGDIVSVLERNGWQIERPTSERTFFTRPGKSSGVSADFHHSMRLFKVFTTSSQFEEGKGYRPFAVYTILEHNGDFSAAARKLASEGYGKRLKPIKREVKAYVDQSTKEMHADESIIDGLQKNHGLSKEEAEEALMNCREIQQHTSTQWWKVTTFKKRDGSEEKKIIINRPELLLFLAEHGFGNYFYDENSTICRLVRVQNNLVEEATIQSVRYFLVDYIMNYGSDADCTPNEVLQVVMAGWDSYLSKAFIETIPKIELDLLKDTDREAYFPFINGVVVVTDDGITMKTYKQINKVIWKSQVKKFRIDIDAHIRDNISLVEFSRFIKGVCNGDVKRIAYAMTIVGYLLHKYKNPTKSYAVVLAEETDNPDNGGGTGKGILVKAISHLLNVTRVDGKNFKLDKSFAFQRVGLDTKLVVIEDVRAKVDFEGFYSIITEGITVEKKNKDELFIPYCDSPKIAFTTNYTIPSTGNHAKRRQRVLEFSNHYSPSFTPEDEFGHKLFDDWDDDEWNRFYNFMFYCVGLYLEEGILQMENSLTIKRKQIKNMFGDEFLEWFSEYSQNGCATWTMSTDLYKEFTIANEMENKDYSMRRFKFALKGASDLFGYELEERRNRQAANRREVRMVVPQQQKVEQEELAPF